MENTLIQPTDFILKQSQRYLDGHILLNDYHSITLNFANFLKQSLAMWQFVPVSESGEVLKEPDFWTWFVNGYSMPSEQDSIHCNEYSKAEERCLFEGFEIYEVHTGINEKEKTISLGGLINVFWFDTITQTWNPSPGFKNIEVLINYGLTLSPTALKQIYG